MQNFILDTLTAVQDLIHAIKLNLYIKYILRYILKSGSHWIGTILIAIHSNKKESYGLNKNTEYYWIIKG